MSKLVIHELAGQSGVPAKTIRYYEAVGLLPHAKRAANNYRQYSETDVERLRFIAGARSLGFSLDDIAEILAARDKGIAPCRRVFETIARRLTEVDQCIASPLAVRDALNQLQHVGAGFTRTV